jgi:type IV secretion system protein VirB5
MKLNKTTVVREVPKDFQEIQANHWDKRYGGLAKDRNMWRMAGFGAIGIAAILAVGYVQNVNRGKFIPYMIEMGKEGQYISTQPASRIKELDVKVVEHTLKKFIYNLRTVSIDKMSLKVNIDELYSFLNVNDPAYTKLTQHFSNPKNDPYKRAARIVTTVKIKTAMKMPSGEWVIKWREDVFTRKGKPIAPLSGDYQAILTTMIVPATIDNEKDLDKANPFGIYVRDISWQRELN